jgi:hypothetical protein
MLAMMGGVQINKDNLFVYGGTKEDFSGTT